MSWFEWTEAMSYVVTIIGLPMAIFVFIEEQRRERQNEEEALYLRLSDEYTAFLKLVLANPDLQLLRRTGGGPLSEEQNERKLAIFSILVSLFERAYLLVYERQMDKQTARQRDEQGETEERRRRGRDGGDGVSGSKLFPSGLASVAPFLPVVLSGGKNEGGS